MILGHTYDEYSVLLAKSGMTPLVTGVGHASEEQNEVSIRSGEYSGSGANLG
jgi:hypothetical protein